MSAGEAMRQIADERKANGPLRICLISRAAAI